MVSSSRCQYQGLAVAGQMRADKASMTVLQVATLTATATKVVDSLPHWSTVPCFVTLLSPPNISDVASDLSAYLLVSAAHLLMSAAHLLTYAACLLPCLLSGMMSYKNT